MEQTIIETDSTNTPFNNYLPPAYPVKTVHEENGSDTCNTFFPNWPEKIFDIIKVKVPNIEISTAFKYKGKDSFFTYIEKKIYYDVSFPVRWRKEGLVGPNIAAKTKARDVCFHIYKKYSLIPTGVAANKERGITIFYKQHDNDRSLIVETFNSSEVVALVNDNTNKTIICCEEIRNLRFNNMIAILHE